MKIRIKKIFSRRLPYYLAFKLKSLLGDFIESIELADVQKKNKEWNHMFLNQPNINHQLYNDIYIKLYYDSLLSRLIFNGFETDEQDFLKSILRPGDFFIDIGANIGLFTLLASNIVGEKGKVICFEPTPLTYNRLLENIKLNNMLNVEPRNIGLSNVSSRLSLNISSNGHDAWNSFVITDNQKLNEKVDVDVSTLDKELEGVDKSKIRAVKIDVEGWEKFVIEGGLDFLTNYSPILLIEFTETNTFSAGYYVYEIYDIMSSLGYNWYRFTEGKLEVESKRIHYPYDNLIALKKGIYINNSNEIIDNNN